MMAYFALKRDRAEVRLQKLMQEAQKKEKELSVADKLAVLRG